MLNLILNFVYCNKSDLLSLVWSRQWITVQEGGGLGSKDFRWFLWLKKKEKQDIQKQQEW